MEAAELYRSDFYAWALDQAAALRRLAETRPNVGVDFERLIEEVEGLAGTELRTARNQAKRAIEHLLKLEFSPSAQPRRGWVLSVNDARDQLAQVLSSTTRAVLEAEVAQVYRRALRDAKVGLRGYDELEAAAALPADCPYTLDELVAEDWFPPNRHGLPDEPS